MRYTVWPLLNVARHNFDGYFSGQPLASADDLMLRVEAESHTDAAEAAFYVGQKMGTDVDGTAWPLDVRSMSMGDVLKIVPDGAHAITRYLACETVGWAEVDPPEQHQIRALVDTDATSRTTVKE